LRLFFVSKLHFQVGRPSLPVKKNIVFLFSEKQVSKRITARGERFPCQLNPLSGE
jgi:hypothetical protein